MSSQDYVVKELTEYINRFDKESTKHKRLYRGMRYVVFGLTACSTTLAGIALALPDFQTQLNIAIVVISASVGVVTSIEGLRKNNELWIHERMIMYALKDLERELNYRTADGRDTSAPDDIFERMQEILGSSRDRWHQQIVGRATTQIKQPQEAVPPQMPPT